MNHADIYWASLPERDGREQGGRRPVIIWQDLQQFSTPTVLIIPLTSQSGALRFPATVAIRPTATNGLSASSVALVFQLGACDVRRLGDRIGRLDDSDVVIIVDVCKRLQKIP